MLKVSSKPFEGYTEYLKRKKENGAPPEPKRQRLSLTSMRNTLETHKSILELLEAIPGFQGSRVRPASENGIFNPEM